MGLALRKLIMHASSTSPDPFCEHRMFFVAPKSAKDSHFDLTELNYYILSTMMKVKDKISLQDLAFQPVYFSLYRNYFSLKAAGAFSL